MSEIGGTEYLGFRWFATVATVTFSRFRIGGEFGGRSARTVTTGEDIRRMLLEEKRGMNLGLGLARHRFLIVLWSLSLVTHCAYLPAQLEQENYKSLVPQHLLGLLHAPQVHQELKLTSQQVRMLESLFSEIDPTWFQARLLPPQEQQSVISALEQKAMNWFAKYANEAQRERIKQLEYRAQGIRMLLRDDVVEKVGLSNEQRDALASLAQASQDATATLQKATMSGKQTEEQKQAVGTAAQAEQDWLKGNATREQMQLIIPLLGAPFDVQQLTRIYPMAPEFQQVKHWINSNPIQLKQLRGKVVLVHFYAFQCHNCHANFEHYRRWHKELRDKGVVVIGIQTPETSRERDPNAVRAAAAEQNLDFPIMIDLESENWKTWGNTMWPTVYVVDQQGYLRHWWQGELNWNGATGDKTIEQLVDQLLSPNAVPVQD
ncbi:MAG: redoxin domain-containing protein [Planctomycetales bacterium]|nr:redoxin domain-containing protein [Planctomycetales bacterium]